MIRTRIAPSPTGSAHIGTIYQALINYAFARRNKGSFIIRIEDTDRQRFVKGAEEELYASLEWFGIEPDEGPGVGGKFGPYRQSERLPLYRKYAEELLNKGFAYPCFCSPDRLHSVRNEQQRAGIPPRYDRHCLRINPKIIEKNLREKVPYVIRMLIPRNLRIKVYDEIRGEIEFEGNVLDDQVILKSNGYPTYHLAVVVDDHLMNITHVIRGEEWISSFPKHVLLYKFFGWKMPKMFHTPILRNPDGSKLSKRHGHASVSWYREKGFLPEAILNFIALLGWSHPKGKEIFSLDEFIKLFDLKDLSPVGPKFDVEKLKWMNGVYIRNMSPDQLISRLRSFNSNVDNLDKKLLKKIILLIQERMKTLSEFEELAGFFFEDELKTGPEELKTLLLKYAGDEESAVNILDGTYELLSAFSKRAWKKGNLEKKLREFLSKGSLANKWKPKQVFMTIRVAISGKATTPPLFETLEVLGKDITVGRLQEAKDLF